MTVAARAARQVAVAALCVATAIAVVAAVVTAVPSPISATIDVPDLSAASERVPARTTTILARDGSTIATFRAEQLHIPTDARNIPAAARMAVIAAEDRHFDSHLGVDLPAVARAVVANTSSGTIAQGGSTITQQLVKNLFTGGEETLKRKLVEAALAVALERRYDKDEILAAYLNTTYFGEGAIGLGAAARTYFRKSAEDLTLSEAALLAGLIPAPTDYNPRVAPEVAERRRLVVLDAVEAAGLASAAEIDAAREEVPVVHPPRRGPARYPYFVDYVRRWLLDAGHVSPRQLFAGGLTVETTLEPALQDAAIAAAESHLPAEGPAAAVVVLDNGTGAVRALVGGRDWTSSKVNLALGAQGGGTGRQAGSAFKPFVLAALLEAGASPLDRVPAPATYAIGADGHEVRNYSRRGYGTVTLAEAMRRSINTAYVVAGERAGPDRVAEVARQLGLRVPARVGPSIALGAYEVSPLGMAAGFAAFARDGAVLQPSPVIRITGPGGNVVLQASPPPARRPIASDTARLVTRTLQDVVERGTGTAARLGRPVAGKTGTTDDYTNAWFVGYTPRATTAVWIGHPSANIPMRDVAGAEGVTGGSLPALVWRDVMSAATAGTEPQPFPPPPDRPPTTTTTRPPSSTTTTARPGTTTTESQPSTTTTTEPPPSSTTTTEPQPSTTTTTEPQPSTTTTTEPQPSTTTTTTTTTTQPSTTTTTEPQPSTTTTQPSTTTTTTTQPSTTTTTEPQPSTTTTTTTQPAGTSTNSSSTTTTASGADEDV